MARSLAILFLAWGAAAWAQTTSSGAIRGTVVDSKGNNLEGVEVRLTSRILMQAKTFKTSSNGGFRFQGLAPGVYTVEADMAGFAPYAIGISVGVKGNTRLSIKMEAAKEPEQPTVWTSDGAEAEPASPAASPASEAAGPPGEAASPGRETVHPGQEAASPAAGAGASGSQPDSAFVTVQSRPVSTFPFDLGTASHETVKQALTEGHMPSAVHIDELINGFTYEYSRPDTNWPYSVTVEVAQAPWKIEHRLVRIGVRLAEPDTGGLSPQERPQAPVIEVQFEPTTVSRYRRFSSGPGQPEASGAPSAASPQAAGARTVTALYEFEPPPSQRGTNEILLTVRLRQPRSGPNSKPLIEEPVYGPRVLFEDATADLQFAAAVAGFGLLLEGGEPVLKYRDVIKIAEDNLGPDPNGERSEFLKLVKKARSLDDR